MKQIQKSFFDPQEKKIIEESLAMSRSSQKWVLEKLEEILRVRFLAARANHDSQETTGSNWYKLPFLWNGQAFQTNKFPTFV